MHSRKSDIVVAVGLLTICAVFAVFTLRIPSVGTGTSAGPAFVPWAMLAIIVVFSLVLMGQAILTSKGSLPDETVPGDGDVDGDVDEGDESKGVLLRIGVFVVLLVVYGAVFMTLGYLATTLAVFIAGMLLLGERKPLQLIVLPVLIVTAIYYGFTEYLGVWLP